MTRPHSLHVNAVPPPIGAREIQRPRLIDFLDSGKATKLTLISAPAGYGTTTLLAQHCCASRKKGIGTAWLGFDERITEPGALMAHLKYAISISQDRAAKEPHIGGIFSGASARRSFNALLAQLTGVPAPFILYIDDIHFADTPETVRFLDDLLLALPEGVNRLQRVSVLCMRKPPTGQFGRR
jgi:ATP/maltotriose-dependent transcriptional regulator MalT